MTTVTLLANPAAGNGHGARVALRAARRLRSRGATVSVVVGSTPEQLRARASVALRAGTDVVAVAGGDGMVHLATQLLATTGVPLGIVPAGTGNDFARSLDLPRRDTVAATDVLLDGAARSLDLGRVNECWFGSVLTRGLDARVSERVNRLDWPPGWARYPMALAPELLPLRATPVELRLDRAHQQREVLLVAVGNTAYYGNGMRICPRARPDDGLLDVTVVDPVPVATLVRFFPRIYQGTHVDHPAVHTFRARTVTVSAPGSRPYADGEPLDADTTHVRAVPNALRVLAPH